MTCTHTCEESARPFIKNAHSAIQEWLRDHVVPGDPGQLLSVLAGLVQEKMGGSSGAVCF